MTTILTQLPTFAYSGASANWATYRGPKGSDYFVEVTRNLHNTFSMRLNKWNPGGKGYYEVASWTYEPKTKVAPGHLLDSTVNRVVRAFVKENLS